MIMVGERREAKDVFFTIHSDIIAFVARPTLIVCSTYSSYTSGTEALSDSIYDTKTYKEGSINSNFLCILSYLLLFRMVSHWYVGKRSFT